MKKRVAPTTTSSPAPASEKTSQPRPRTRNLNKHRMMIAAKRAKEAFELHLAGWGWDEIAAKQGYANRSCAWLAADRWMRRLVQVPAEKVRKIEVERTRLLIRKVMEVLEKHHPVLYKGKIVTDPKTKQRLENSAPVFGAIERLISIMERRAKLLGLDMPVKIAPTNPEGDKPYDPLHVYVPDNLRETTTPPLSTDTKP